MLLFFLVSRCKSLVFETWFWKYPDFIALRGLWAGRYHPTLTLRSLFISYEAGPSCFLTGGKRVGDPNQKKKYWQVFFERASICCTDVAPCSTVASCFIRTAYSWMPYDRCGSQNRSAPGNWRRWPAVLPSSIHLVNNMLIQEVY